MSVHIHSLHSTQLSFVNAFTLLCAITSSSSCTLILRYHPRWSSRNTCSGGSRVCICSLGGNSRWYIWLIICSGRRSLLSVHVSVSISMCRGWHSWWITCGGRRSLLSVHVSVSVSMCRGWHSWWISSGRRSLWLCAHVNVFIIVCLFIIVCWWNLYSGRRSPVFIGIVGR